MASFHVYIRLECYCAMYAMYISNIFDKSSQSNIKKVKSKNVCVCSFPIFNVFDIHSITALKCT